MNNFLVKIKLSKTQLNKIGSFGGFLGRFLGPLLKDGLPLMKNALKPLDKSVLITLGLIAAASAAIHKKMFGSSYCPLDLAFHLMGLASPMKTLIILNDEMNGTIKIIKSLKESGLLIKGASETIQNEENNKKEDFSACY